VFEAEGMSQLFQLQHHHQVGNVFLEGASSVDLKGGSERQKVQKVKEWKATDTSIYH
jgi:hypothetical protein